MADEVVGRRSALKLGGMAAIGAVGAGAAALAPQVASAAGPLTYNTISPFRSVATPSFGLPKLRSGESDDWDLWTDVNANAQLPSNIQAVTYNLTITQTEGAAFLAIIPAGTAWGGISSINWTARNVDIANGGTVALGVSSVSGPGSCTVICGGVGAATHYLIDVTGYYV
jgi:hypothetical protein